MLELRALGNAEIETDTTTLTPSQEIVFASALYLVLEREKRTSRTELAELLWPTVNVSTRGHRLRQTLLQLKKLGFPVVADRNTLRLSTLQVKTDVDSMLRAEGLEIKSEQFGEFLPGYSPLFSEPFRDWVDAERSAVHSALARCLLPKIERARGGGDWAVVEEYARRCLILDPYNEVAVLAKAEATAMRGAKQQAVKILDEYIEDVGSSRDLVLPASLLRRRISTKIEHPNPLTSTDPAFVGRDAEIRFLTEGLARAREGNGGGRLIMGDPGIGKSRLAREVAEFSAIQGIQVQRVTCRHSDVDRPLSVFVDLVPGLRDLPGALGCSPETVTALKRLTEFDGRGTEPLLPAEDLTSLFSTMRRALFDLLDAIVDEQSLLIVVDDVHWLDQASSNLLMDMIRWASHKKLLFLLCSRIGTREVAPTKSPFDLPTLELSPLPRDSSLRLLQATLETQPRRADPETIAWLLTAGDGNPFFLQELAKRWLETGHKQEVPPSLTTVLDDRLSRLSPEAISVLQACAVLGENSTVDRIEAVLEYKPHELLTAIQELCIAGMLAAQQVGPGEVSRRIHVKHDLLSLAAVAKLAPVSLAFIHGRAGRITEREISGERSPTSILWACAFHWSKAGDRQRALAVVCSCAEHLLEVGLPSDTVRALERALDYCITDEDRLAVYSRLVVALQMSSNWEQSKEILIKCRRLRQTIAPDATHHDDLEIRLFDARWKANLETQTLLAELLVCVDSPEASAIHRVACGLLSLKVGSDLGENESMRRVYEVIEPLLDSGVVPAAMKFEVRMVFHSIWGDVNHAMASMEGLLAVVRTERNPLTFSRALGNAGVACRLAGRNTEAASLFTEAVEYSLSHGLPNRAATAGISLVRLYLATGRILEARHAMDEIGRSANTGDDVHYDMERIYLASRVALEEGKFDAAAALYTTLQSRVNSSLTVNRRGAALALGVRIGIKCGVPVETLRETVDQLHNAHILSRTTGLQDFEAVSLFLGLRQVGMPSQAANLLREYAEIHRREKWPLPQEIVAHLTSAQLTSCAHSHGAPAR